MKAVIHHTRCVAALLLLAVPVPASAQQPAAATLRATGTFASNGTFAGTVTVNRFEQRNGQIVAVGVVQGTLSRPNGVIGTALATDVTWPVRVVAGSVQLAGDSCVSGPRIVHAAVAASRRLAFRPALAQSHGCTPLHINLEANNVDLMGLQVALDPIGLTVTGAAGTPLGDLVCAAEDLLGNAAGLVNVLNNLLALIIGLLGGTTTGLAGAA